MVGEWGLRVWWPMPRANVAVAEAVQIQLQMPVGEYYSLIISDASGFASCEHGTGTQTNAPRPRTVPRPA
jgi:hypothetical protein